MRDRPDSLFAFELGRALRRARGERRLRLRDVAARSDGRIKASTLGSYERGERTLSLERFVELAFLYEVPPATLLRRALAGGATQEDRVLVDRGQLDLVSWPEREWLAELTDRVAAWRGRGRGPQAVIPVRSGDVVDIATAHGLTTAELTARWEAALSKSKDVIVVDHPSDEPRGESQSGTPARAG